MASAASSISQAAAPAEQAGARQLGAWRKHAVQLLIAAVGAGGVAAIVISVLVLLPHPERLPLVLVAGALVLGVVRMEAVGSRVTLSAIPMIAAGFLAGPPGAAICGLAATLAIELRTGKPNPKTIFNLGIWPLAGGAAAAACLPLGVTATSAIPLLILYGLVYGLVFFAVNAGTVGLAMCLDLALNPFTVWRERFSWMVVPTLLLGQVGVGLALAYRRVGLYEVAVFALPVVVVQLAWRQYLEHTRRSVEDLRAKNNDLIQAATRLQTANETISATYRETLDALILALDARDNEVQGHSYRVSVFSQEIARQLGVSIESEEFEAIARGALLHDVGKIGVRDAVLLKPGKLDQGEWVEMQQHPDIGFGILRDVEFLRPAANLVRAHHEKFDGTGYPLGLKGEEIPLGARIFAVADTFDAITTDRPYRGAAPPQAAVAEIRRCAGSQFDPLVVDVFEAIWQRLWELRESAASLAA